MDNGIYKAAIASVTGMQVGERDGVWVVKDTEGWRALFAAEETAVTAEYDRMQKEMSVPQKLTPQQFHRGLYNDGLYDQAVAAISSNFEYKLFFEKSLEFDRKHPLLNEIAKGAFGMTDDQIDAKFIAWSVL